MSARSLLVGLVLLSAPSTAAQPIFYVDTDAPGADDGTSWADAFNDLQDALAAAMPGTALWVAEGIYVPTETVDPTATFHLKSGIALYGGFNGTETALEDRDWIAYETVLSGDISAGRSYHVVTGNGVDATARLDGFTIRQGDATEAPVPDGGGVLLLASDATLSNCTIRENRAVRGGGLFNDGGSPMLAAVVIEGNESRGFGARGGGLYTRGGALTWTDGGLHDNRVQDFDGLSHGGGAYLESETLAFDRVQISANEAFGDNGRGGGVYAMNGSFTVRSSQFVGNRATTNFLQAQGGGVYLEDGTSVFLGVEFRQNEAQSFRRASGGAVFTAAGTAAFVNCLIANNTVLSMSSTGGGGGVSYGGGASHTGSSVALYANSLLYSNEAASNTGVENFGEVGGGAIYANGSALTLVNATVTRNVVRDDSGSSFRVRGSGLYAMAGTATVRNSIFWEDSSTAQGADEIEGDGISLSHSLVAGGHAGTQVIDADPLFANPDADGFRLTAGSPAVDFGLAAFLPPDTYDLDADGDTTEPLPLDIDSQSRVQGSALDLGAYESPFAVAADPVASIPLSPTLAPAFPNPFDRTTALRFTLPRSMHVALVVYDLLGREIITLADKQFEKGDHVVHFEGTRLPSGIYLYRFVAGGTKRTGRVGLVR